VLGERAPNDGAGGAVFSTGALLERDAELVGNDCGNLRHGSAYRLVPRRNVIESVTEVPPPRVLLSQGPRPPRGLSGPFP